MPHWATPRLRSVREGARRLLAGWEWRLLAGISVATLLLLVVVLTTEWGFYRSDVNGSRLYLLSSIVQGLAAILALLVTLSLLATQLSATVYTPRIVRRRLTDFWLWGAVFIYLAAIGGALLVLSGLGNWLRAEEQDGTNIALILAGAALAYLVPFTLATIKGLDPVGTARWLVERDDQPSLDELMRRAVNEGTLTLLVPALSLFTNRAMIQLERAQGAAAQAQRLVSLFLSVGRHSCQRHNPDALTAVMEQLTALITYCNAPPRLWRGAADIFNEAIKELYFYSEEWLGTTRP